jgi:hypothetical protein
MLVINMSLEIHTHQVSPTIMCLHKSPSIQLWHVWVTRLTFIHGRPHPLFRSQISLLRSRNLSPRSASQITTTANLTGVFHTPRLVREQSRIASRLHHRHTPTSQSCRSQSHSSERSINNIRSARNRYSSGLGGYPCEAFHCNDITDSRVAGFGLDGYDGLFRAAACCTARDTDFELEGVGCCDLWCDE